MVVIFLFNISFQLFTLMERTAQFKRADILIDGSSISANFPFRADSLIPIPTRATAARDGVTMSREGKPAVMVDCGLHLRHSPETESQPIAGHLKRNHGATRSQSERPGKFAGCRMTNDRKHRKVTPGEDCWQSRGRSEVASRCSIGEACHPRGSKWEEAPAGLTGVKGDGMRGKIRSAKSGEVLHGSARISLGIRSISENPDEAVQDGGDGRSTQDPRPMTNLGEERAISLKGFGGKERLA